MSTAAIRVVGLKELSRALRKMDTDLPKAMRTAWNTIGDRVIQTARADVPRRSGRAAASIKPRSTRTELRVTAGGNRAPYYPWLDFGGRVGRKRSVARPFYSDGRYLYPAYHKHQPEIPDLMSAAIQQIAAAAGIEVS